MSDWSAGGGVSRSLRELNFEDNDRVPIVGGFVCKANFLEKVAGRGPFWDDPRKTAIEAYRRLGTDLIMQFVLPKKGEESTQSTTPTNFTKANRPPAYHSPEDVIAQIHRLPSIRQLREDFDIDQARREYARMMMNVQKEMGDMLWVPYTGGACRFMWYSEFGYRPYFLAVMKYPHAVEELYRYSGEEARLRNKAIAQAIVRNDLPPFVYFGEDICYNKGPMIPVSLLDEIYFPHLRRAMEPLKESGINIIWHSDGNIMPIVHHLIECGVDGFQGFQEETGTTLEKLVQLRSKRGRKLILWGSISVTSTLPFGTVRDVEREVERCIDTAAEGGGFFVAPSSSVGPEVPDQNILAMYRHAIEYGKRARG